MPIVHLGLALTVYCTLSFILFFATSFTINGWILYLVVLPLLHGGLVLGSWASIFGHRPRIAHVRWRIWGVILALQIATMIVSPGNCYGTTSHGLCYSNLQVLVGNVPRTGPSNAPHWPLVENSFPGFLLAYSVALTRGVTSILVVRR